MTGPNYNTNTTGGTLQGLGELFRGLGAFRDPDQERRARLAALLQQNPQLRDQYIEQYAGNPDAINSLLGKKPRWGSSTDYDQLRTTLGGPLSSDAQAKMAKNKATIAEDKNKEILASTLKPTLERGRAYDEFVNYGTGGQTIPAPTEQTPGVENIPVQKGPGIAADDYARYQEAISSGGIRTPDQRAADKAKLDRELLATNLAKASAPLAQLKIQKETKELQDEKEADVAYTAINARQAAGKAPINLYEARIQGKISPQEHQLAGQSPKYEKQYDKDQMAYFQNQADKRQRELSANAIQARLDAKQMSLDARDSAFADRIVEKSLLTPSPISKDDALAIIQNPRAILDSKDSATQYIRDTLKYMGAADQRKNKADAYAAFSKLEGVREILKNQSVRGYNFKQEDVDALNTMARAEYRDKMVPPPKFYLRPGTKPGFVNELTRGYWATSNEANKIGVIGEDDVTAPFKAHGIEPDTTKTKGKSGNIDLQQSDSAVDAAIAHADSLKLTPEQFAADMKAHGVPDAKIQEILSRRKGSAPDSSITRSDTTTATKPKLKAASFKADTTDLPPVTQITSPEKVASDTRLIRAREIAAEDVSKNYRPNPPLEIRSDYEATKEYWKEVDRLLKLKNKK